MKKFFLFQTFIIVSLCSFSQKTKSPTNTAKKKYNSLMWEISGNGLKKKAYLFGTMHVSGKVAFNLSDTFYNAIKSVDAVAIENDPLTWQQDYNESIFTKLGGLYSASSNALTKNYISKNSFQFVEPEQDFKLALAMDPEIVNQFLYRSYTGSADFEEETYLDMHIFQCGKRLGKKVIGLENFKETERLILKGMRASAGESKRKSKSTEADEDEADKTKSIGEKIQDAYRNGDLDMLDSLNKKEETSEAFNEYFLYARNQIHADGIDKTLKNGQSIFAAVGAAHLPGKRGVIEMLRNKGYTLRPVFMGLQLSKQREEINKIFIPTSFSKQYASDSLFSVETPGLLYNFNYASKGQKQWLHADFSNGAYYMVTRVSTNGLLWGKNANDINKKIDSLLYENIPGKILDRTTISNNGFNGYNIVNKTRKGDVQRYNIFITPLELIVFKMSGFEDYVKGKEGDQFFSSIKLNATKNNWNTFTPALGGYNIKLPHQPIENAGNGGGTSNYLSMFMGNSNGINKGYEAYDEKSETYVSILEKNFMNYDFLEEDTFNLALASESFLTTTNFQAPTKRVHNKQNNIPYLEVSGKCNDNTNYITRTFLVGTKYYTVITKFKKANSVALDILNSFNYAPIITKKQNYFVDSLLKFTVSSSLAPDSLKQEFISISRLAKKVAEEDEKSSKTEEPYWRNFDDLVFKDDSTDEELMLKVALYPKYYAIKDTLDFWKSAFEKVNSTVGEGKDEYDDFVIKEKKYTEKDSQKIYDVVFADTNSTQTITSKFIINNGRMYVLYCFSHASFPLSPAKQQFFESFKPMFDSAANFSLFTSKSKKYFSDFFSKDSTVSKFARKNLAEVTFLENDLQDIVGAINKLDAKHKDYFTDKEALIRELSFLRKDTSMPHILNSIYTKTTDTATFQNACIVGLANAKTKQSFDYLSNILINDPPVFEDNSEISAMFYDLRDTLQISKNILPQLLPLASLDDYKWPVLDLIAEGLDSNQITEKDYETLYSKIYFDARIALKKLLVSDEKLLNKQDKVSEDGEKVEDKEDEDKTSDNSSLVYDLEVYAKLLIPFWNKNQNVPNFFDKLVHSKNPKAKFEIAKVLFKNKKPVSDTIWTDVAKDEKFRLSLFEFLKKNNKENLMPAHLTKQQLFCKSLLQNNDYSKKDSLVYLNTYLPATVKSKKGNVLFFKYKKEEKDVDWKIALCGLQPEDITKVNTDETIIEFTEKVLKTNKSLQDQLQKVLKEQLYSLRKSSSKFYNESNYDFSRYFDR